MLNLRDLSAKLEQENKIMALDIQEINEENALNIEKVNDYSASLKRIKKERDDNINEFESEVLKL